MYLSSETYVYEKGASNVAPPEDLTTHAPIQETGGGHASTDDDDDVEKDIPVKRQGNVLYHIQSAEEKVERVQGKMLYSLMLHYTKLSWHADIHVMRTYYRGTTNIFRLRRQGLQSSRVSAQNAENFMFRKCYHCSNLKAYSHNKFVHV